MLNYEFSNTPGNDGLVVSNSGGLTLNSAGFNLFVEGTVNKWANTGTFNLIQYTGAIGGTGLDASWTTVSGSNPHILNPQTGLTYGFSASGGFIALTIGATATLSNWNVNAGGIWGSGRNWSAGVPNAHSDTANFLSAISSLQTVTLDGNKSVGTLQFSNANAYTIAQGSGGSLILNNANGAQTAQVTVANGSHTVSAPVSLVSNTAVEVSNAADTLTISGAISGASLTKTGNGTLALTSANTLAATTLQGGTIVAGNAGALGTGTLTLSGNATLSAGIDGLTIANMS